MAFVRCPNPGCNSEMMYFIEGEYVCPDCGLHYLIDEVIK